MADLRTFALNDFRRRMRIELHPATDRWMRGDRCGTIVGIGRKLLKVQMDVSGQTIKVAPGNVDKII